MRSTVTVGGGRSPLAFDVNGIIALRALSTVLPLIGLLAACAAQRPASRAPDLSTHAAPPSSYRLKVVFVWGVGDNPYREIVLRVRVGEEFYAKVSDEAGNYHAISGTLRPKGGGEFLLPIELTNWSPNGSTVGTMDLTISLSQGFGGGTNAGGYSVTLLPDHEISSNQSAQPMPGERLRFNRAPLARHGWPHRSVL